MTGPSIPSILLRNAAVAASVTPIVALDVPAMREAGALVDRLGDSCRFYKLGLELFTAEGPDAVKWLRDRGKQVFLDLKLHDIPNTVRGAARSAARLGVSLLTVHASGGKEMVAAAVQGAAEGAADQTDESCGILGVTVLTSLDAAGVEAAWGRHDVEVRDEVVRLAGLVRHAGGLGIVCSGHEAASVRAVFGRDVHLLIPGIRLPGADAQDQKRVMTPRAAAEAGARWIILGRTVTAAANPLAAMETVQASLAGIA